ncbi:MAG TPA: M3 family metallopeptidase, partial [Acidobacteriota bacterium]|nr:M3 family metallopeptidase [Acidobacteriota bacterium]
MQTKPIAAVPRRLAAMALIALVAAATGAEAAATKGTGSTKPSQPARFYTGSPDAAAFKAACDEGTKNAKAALDRMLAVTGTRTVANTLDAYNEVIVHAYNVAYPAGLMESVHPDSAYRAVAEGVTQEIDKFLTDLSLNRAVYDALVAVDAKGLDPETRYFRERTLREFRRSGVDRDDATRKRVSELNERLTLLSQQFSRNIRNDRRFVTVNSVEELKGLPEDYLKAHPPGEDGKIKITVETPDYVPVLKYAENGDLRRKLRLERQNRAYPANMTVLDSLILVRHELATLLGYPHWAAYVTEDKMIGTAENAAAFLDRVSKLVVSAARDEYQIYLKTKREFDSNATSVDLSEASYIENIIRKRDYDFDSQAARPYFPFPAVKKGVMDLSARIFNVQFRKIEDAAVWHPTVEAYEVYDGKKLLGRFFLDLHPRE